MNLHVEGTDQTYSSEKDQGEQHTGLLSRLWKLPIAQFYLYMWNNDKSLLLTSLVVNYLLPLALELLPFVFRLYSLPGFTCFLGGGSHEPS